MLVNQPYEKPLGIQLIEEIESGIYNQLTIIVAYAKLSGVYRLLPYIDKFKKNGGTIRIVVGIDQQNTTYDALHKLLKLSDSLYVFHSESLFQTFHIKCYWLKGINQSWYAVGSNNFTAGGLFSNFELCEINILKGTDSQSINDKLESIYQLYANSKSECTKEIDEDFLSQLLESKYITKEIEQKRILINEAKFQKSSDKIKLFGRNSLQNIKLPNIANKQETKDTHITNRNYKSYKTISNSISNNDYNNSYLIRLIPKAGNRSKQVHFTIELLEKYFKLSPGDEIFVQEILPSGGVGNIENRQIVFSQRNRNVKIELNGASMLDTNYPQDIETRPVLVLKRIDQNLFAYMILLNGNSGYSAINERLKQIPTGKSLPYEVIDENTMFTIWNDCPIT